MIEVTPQNHEQQRIVVIGGGHGTAAIFPAIAEMTPNAMAVISASDNGGSTRQLRAKYDLPAMGDAANAITASSRLEAIRELNGWRYTEGPLAGHTPKNLDLTWLMLRHGAQEGIHRYAAQCQANGTFLLATETPHQLVLEDGPGNFIVGEDVIDTHTIQSAEPRISYTPAVHITEPAKRAVLEADHRIIYASGSPFTSQLAALCVGGMREALRTSKAEKIAVVNLANEQHDTPNWHVVDYVKLLLRHGLPVDTAVYNTDIAAVEATGKQPAGTSAERFDELPHIRFIGAAVATSELGHNRVVHDAQALLRRLDIGAVDKVLASAYNTSLL